METREELAGLYPEADSQAVQKLNDDALRERQLARLPKLPRLRIAAMFAALCFVLIQYILGLGDAYGFATAEAGLSQISSVFLIGLIIMAAAYLIIKAVNNIFYAYGQKSSYFWIVFFWICIFTVAAVIYFGARIEELVGGFSWLTVSVVFGALVYFNALVFLRRVR